MTNRRNKKRGRNALAKPVLGKRPGLKAGVANNGTPHVDPRLDFIPEQYRAYANVMEIPSAIQDQIDRLVDEQLAKK
jgi:hypothetical protein